MASYSEFISAQDVYEGMPIEPKVVSSEEYSVSGVPGLKVRYEQVPYGDTDYAAVKDGYLYRINYEGMSEDAEEERRVLDEIMEKFKFTK